MNAPFPAGEDTLLALLRTDPTNVSLLDECVRAALAKRHPVQALSAIDIAQAGDTPHGRYLRATVLLHQQRWREAIELLRSVLHEPGALNGAARTNAEFALGYGLLQAGETAAATECLAACIARAEPAPKVLAYLLRAAHLTQGPRAAAAEWERVPKAWRDAEACGVQALICFDLGQVPEARRLARLSLSEQPDCREARVAAAGLALLDGDTDTAISLLELELSARPEDGRTWSTLAAARFARQDLDGALQAYRKAVQTMTEHIGTWIGMAWVHMLQKRWAEARHCLDRAMAIDDRFGETHGCLAVLSALTGDQLGAERYALTARRLDPQGMAWRYANALLSGEGQDPGAVQKLADRLLSERGVGTRLR